MFKRNSTQGTLFNRYGAQAGQEITAAAMRSPQNTGATTRSGANEVAGNSFQADQPLFIVGKIEAVSDVPADDAPEDSIDGAGAEKIVAMAEAFVRLPKTDLAYAKGYMDTERAQHWLDDAGNMLIKAKAAIVDGRFEQAVANAEAARALAGTADMLLAQTLGIGRLPAHRNGANEMPANQDRSQDADRVRLMLLNAHQNISAHSFRVAASAEARDYLAQARSYYKNAYGAFVDGAYQAAYDAVSLVEGLVLVTGYLIAAAAPQPGQEIRRTLSIQRV